MIICNNCGSPLDSESIFCKECGSPTPLAAQSAERPTRTPTQESLRPVLPEDVSAGSQSGSMQSARSSRAGDDVSFADIAGCFGCLILLLAAVGLGIYFLPGQTGEDVRSYFARILSIDPTPTPVPTPTPFPSPTPLPSPTPRSTPTTFPTATSTPSPPPQSEIDRILAGLDWGAASFNAPQSMNLGETRSIYLRVGATSSAGELEELIARELKRSEQEGERVESGRVRVADHMEARLTGPASRSRRSRPRSRP